MSVRHPHIEASLQGMVGDGGCGAERTKSKTALSSRTGRVAKHARQRGKPTGASSSRPQPPAYPKEPHAITHHGDTRVDDYFWLANRKDPRVRALIEKENAALEHFFTESQASFTRTTRSALSSVEADGRGDARAASPPLQRQLFREMKQRWKEDDVSLPTLDRSYWYYVRHVRNAQYPLFCRRPHSKEKGVNVNFLEEMCELWRHDPAAAMPRFADEVIFLDVNLLVQERKLSYAEIGEMDISPDERELALTLDCSGGKEVFTVFILPIRNVDYAGWLEHDSDALHRAWAKELEHAHESVYSPLTSASSLALGSPASSAGGFPSARRQPKTRKQKSALQPPAAIDQATDGSCSETPTSVVASPCSPVPTPCHTITHTIDVFDISSEVLWVSARAIMYIAVDDKMRKHQVVYHDLTVADPSDASFIVFEEDDESFWVGSLCFTADDAYVTFCTSSTEVSEWYAVPVSAAARALLPPAAGTENEERHGKAGQLDAAPPPSGSASGAARGESGAGANRTLTGVPIAQERLRVELTNKTGADKRRRTAPVLQFSARAVCPVEYDLDHHKALLAPPTAGTGEGGGAWIMVGNPAGCVNFAVFFLPDSVVAGAATLSQQQQQEQQEQQEKQEQDHHHCPHCHPAAGREEDRAVSSPCLYALPSPSPHELRWWPLFGYEADVRVEGVESYFHFLLVSVRRKGHPTTLFCPIERVWRWWAETTHHLGHPAEPLSLSRDLFDLSELLDAFPQLYRHEAAPPQVCTATVPFRGATDAQGSCGTDVNAADEGGEGRELVVAGRVPDVVASLAEVQATPLRYAVECYAGCTSYYTTRWRMSVSHVLRPSLQLQCEYHASAPHEVDSSHLAEGATGHCSSRGQDIAFQRCERTAGTISVLRLKEEMVGGPAAYRADDYEGAILWVPSNHFVRRHCTDEEGLSRLVPTREPSAVTRIPVTACWRRDGFAVGGNPMVVHVYGGYGDSEDPDFSTERLSLLDRGVAWAYAAVRGGGELGVPWRDAGRKLQRATTVNDYLSVVSYLQDTGLCKAGRLIGCGGSAGGVAVCRAMHQAPELFFAVIGSAPFVDCLTSLLDGNLPLSVTEREEFGDPVVDADAYHLLKSLSPTDTVDHLAAVVRRRMSTLTDKASLHELPALPHVLLVTSWEDTRVGYWEPMKLAAALRAKVYGPVQEELRRRIHEEVQQHPDGPDASAALLRQHWPHLLFCCDFEAGHAGASGRYQQLKEIAREYAFLLHVLALQDAEAGKGVAGCHAVEP